MRQGLSGYSANVILFCLLFPDGLCAAQLGLHTHGSATTDPTATWHGASESTKKGSILHQGPLALSTDKSNFGRSMSKIPQRVLTVSELGQVLHDLLHSKMTSTLRLGLKFIS